MIVHCMIKEQIEDVIKTERLTMSKADINTLVWYVNEKFEVCIDTENSFWYDYRNAKPTITPYSDWKLMKLLQTQNRIRWNNGIEVNKLNGDYRIYVYNELVELGWNTSDAKLFNKIKYYEESAKMKEMYSLHGKFYGTFGEATDMTYEDGSIIHTGDIVESFCDNKSYGLSLACNDGDNYGVMGVWSSRFTNGKSYDWSIKLVCKYYNNNRDKVGNITIVDNDQFIQLEGGKLNITKAKRLGLWQEDKKVFTIDKDCEIECEDYEVFSTSSLFNEDRRMFFRQLASKLCL